MDKKNASGLLSIIWRKQWDFKNSKKMKNRLILYNIEDCVSLYHVKESENLNELFKHSGFKFGKIKFNIETFEHINNTAYFDYQTKKYLSGIILTNKK